MPDQVDPRRTTLVSQIESLIAIDRSSLLRPDLSEMSFQKAGGNVGRIFRLLLRLKACDLDLLSENKFQVSVQFVAAVNGVFNQMKTFSPLRSNTAPAAERNQIVDQCERIIVEANESLFAVFAIAAPTLQEADQEVRLILEGARLNASQMLEEIKVNAEKVQKEIELALESVRAATGAIGIEKQAEVFKNAAQEHSTARKRWLVTTLLIAAITLGTLLTNWFLAYKMGPPSSSLALVQLAIAKILVFSLLLSAVLWSSKVYRSHQHNYVVNKHRQNALETFQLFARAAEADAETKSMVLLQATKCIFTSQATGFLPGDKETEGTPQILEIIRGLSTATRQPSA